MLTYRRQQEKRLEAIPALTDDVRSLLSPDGFLSLFLEIRGLYPTFEEAYEYLESQHERIIGYRMYSEYDSFRRVILRWRNEKRLPK